ncbi:MAG: DUF3224 domain-containing protein [Cyclobacteriaceae bacterium]
MKIKGTFEVKLSPMDYPHAAKDELQIGRMSIDKRFFGDLDAHSLGEMLSAVSGSQAGYVALEQVSGSLTGKKGSFALQHFGLMKMDGKSLKLEVVPGSGRGELEGLTGSMQIIIKDGQHLYEFDYELT